MAEEHPQLSREEVRQMIDAARERLEARRQEMAREQREPLERVHMRDRADDHAAAPLPRTDITRERERGGYGY